MQVTFRHFQQIFNMDPLNSSKYPTLSLIVAVEEDLIMSNYLAPVLAWWDFLLACPWPLGFLLTTTPHAISKAQYSF